MKHSGKTILVTGGGRGLGRAIALRLAAAGADLLITYVGRRESAEAVATEIRALGRKAVVLRLDVADTRSFAAFAEELAAALKTGVGRPTLDGIVNNAGIIVHKPFAETTEEDFDALQNTHLKGVYFLTQRLLPLLADGAAIVNTSSGLARFAIPGYSAYGALKAGVEHLTRYLAKELGPRRIRVNCLAPGLIETDLTADSLQNPAVRAGTVAATALGRIGQPDDIGGVVAFLLSDDAKWITGQRLEVSGGVLL